MEPVEETALSQLAQTELLVLADVEEAENQTRESLAAARRESDLELAGIQAQIQEERRKLVSAAHEKADHEAEVIRAAAAAKAEELSAVVTDLIDGVVDELVRTVLPKAKGLSDRDGKGK